MRKSKREGFQFSFGLKEPQECFSSRSTPKFPSIEIAKTPLGGSQRKQYPYRGYNEPSQLKKSRRDLFMDIGGGVELFQRGGRSRERPLGQRPVGVALQIDTGSVKQRDNKSVKSSKSLRQRFLKQARKGQLKNVTGGSTKRNKHSSSLANILEMKMDSLTPSSKRLEERRVVRPSPFTLGEPESAFGQKTEERDTLKMEGPFFEGRQNIELRETTKMALALGRSRFGQGERDRSKIFKNLMHRPRPTLRLGARANTNDRIQSISKHYNPPSPF